MNSTHCEQFSYPFSITHGLTGHSVSSSWFLRQSSLRQPSHTTMSSGSIRKPKYLYHPSLRSFLRSSFSTFSRQARHKSHRHPHLARISPGILIPPLHFLYNRTILNMTTVRHILK